jgi:hypothetical protein
MLKRISIVIVVIVLLLFLPVAPSFIFTGSDPDDVNDKRVTASINNVELKEILSLVRGGDMVSMWDYFTIELDEEILIIKNSGYTWESIGSGAQRKHVKTPNVGKVEVYVGYVCGSLCGQGIIYRLTTENGKWKIIGSSRYIA